MAFSYLQQTKWNLSQSSPTVRLIRQWKLLLPVQTTTPTAAASPVRLTTTEMVPWSLPRTTETQRWHTTGRPRGAGWRPSRWLKVRWNPPEHRRTKSFLSSAKLTNRRWFGVETKKKLLLPHLWARGAGDEEDEPLSALKCSISWEQGLKDSLYKVKGHWKITPWRTQPTKLQLILQEGQRLQLPLPRPSNPSM